MTWTLAEGLVDQVVTFMNANMAAQLNDIDAEMADSIILDDIQAFETSERVLASVQSFPIMIILIDSTGIPQWSGVEVWGEHRLVMGILVKDQDLTDLRKRIYRYGRAMWELIGDAHNDGSVTFQLGVGESVIDFSPMFSTPDSRFIADVTVKVPVTLKETR